MTRGGLAAAGASERMTSLEREMAVGNILPLREQARIVNAWLRERLETILPRIMEREGLEAWIVVAREYNEDPVSLTLVPEPAMAARRRTILVFHLAEPGRVERFTLDRYSPGDLYQAAWKPEEEDQWECLSRLIRELNPSTIGINVSETFAFGDGLTHSEHGRLIEALGPEYASRTRSAEGLAVGWLETRIPSEMEVYHGIVRLCHDVIEEAYSSRQVHPDVTTTEDLSWWIRQKISDLGLESWFQPSIDLQRADRSGVDLRGSIRAGDLLHCDVGLRYLGLVTDIQRHAYVLRPGEKGAPRGLERALRAGNRAQDILAGCFEAGKSGNQILREARTAAEREGLKATFYTHPLGIHGHGAGPTIGLWDNQEGIPGRGDYRLHEDTCYALELNVMHPVEEWDREVRIALEEDIVFKGGEVQYLAGRQEQLYIIG